MKKLICLLTVILLSAGLIVFAGTVIGSPAKVSAASGSNTISIFIPSECQEMGSYSISAEDATGVLTQIPNTADNKFTFTSGTIIVIKALPNPYYKFIGFKQNYKSELQGTDSLRVNVLSDRTLVLQFEKELIDLGSNITTKASNAKITVTYDDITVGSEVYVSVKMNTFFQIKDFFINGIAVNSDKYAGDVTFAGNLATIHITDAWLAGYGDTLNIEVTTKVNDTYAIFGLCTVIIIPMLAILAIYMIVLNNRAKKTAAASVKSKQVTMQRMKTGDYISGIREGKITNVDKKQIKQEIEKNK